MTVVTATKTKQISWTDPITSKGFFCSNKPKSAYNYVTSGDAFKKDENDATIQNRKDLKKYLASLKTR